MLKSIEFKKSVSNYKKSKKYKTEENSVHKLYEKLRFNLIINQNKE